MFDGSQVSDDEGRAASSDIHLVTVGLSLRQGQDGGWGDLMGVETHQRTVDIEEQCVRLHSNKHSPCLVGFE